MAELNFENRTLFHGDNLEFPRGMNSASIDLIATDPPFNKSADLTLSGLVKRNKKAGEMTNEATARQVTGEARAAAKQCQIDMGGA